MKDWKRELREKTYEWEQELLKEYYIEHGSYDGFDYKKMTLGLEENLLKYLFEEHKLFEEFIDTHNPSLKEEYEQFKWRKKRELNE